MKTPGELLKGLFYFNTHCTHRGLRALLLKEDLGGLGDTRGCAGKASRLGSWQGGIGAAGSQRKLPCHDVAVAFVLKTAQTAAAPLSGLC